MGWVGGCLGVWVLGFGFGAKGLGPELDNNVTYLAPLSAAHGSKNETPLKLSVITAGMALMMMA